jgi:hypothetical protein
VKLPDRQALDECRAHFGGDDEEPVRLAVIRGELRKELVIGDASRGRERILARISSAIQVAETIPLRFSVTSRYASSSDSGSMTGVYSAKICRIWSETSL